MATGRKFYLLNKIINNEIKITRLDLKFHFNHKVDAYSKLIIFMQNLKRLELISTGWSAIGSENFKSINCLE